MRKWGREEAESSLKVVEKPLNYAFPFANKRTFVMSSGHFIPSKTNRVNDIIFVFLTSGNSGVLFQNKGFTAGSQLDQRMLAKGQLLLLSKIDLRAATQPFTLPWCKGKVSKGSLLAQESVVWRGLWRPCWVFWSEAVTESLLLLQSTSSPF